MYVRQTCILLVLVLMCTCVFAQKKKYVKSPVKTEIIPEGFEKAVIRIGDSVFIMTGNCKNNWTGIFTAQPVEYQKIPIPAKDPFLKVHGNVLYNFLYRSYIDTPFAQHDLQQHLVQTNLRITVQNKYPINLTITNRSSNSPYFKNLTDVAFNFNRRYMLDNIKADLMQRASSFVTKNSISVTEAVLQTKMQQVKELQIWLNSPARIQEFVEEKEQALNEAALATAKVNTASFNNLIKDEGLTQVVTGQSKFKFPSKEDIAFPKTIKGINPAHTFLQPVAEKAKAALKKNVPQLSNGNIVSKKINAGDSTLLQKFNAKKQQLDKLLADVRQEEASLKKYNKKIQDSVTKIKQQINTLQSPASLYAFMKQKGIAKAELTKAQRVLLSINQFGIGRSWVDYSELTVKNISIAGINVEANPGNFYVAFAAGKVNYRFRDFIFRNNTLLPNQQVHIIRAGVGNKEKNNLIASFYGGRKTLLNTAAPFSLQRVMGFSVETKFAVNANNYIIAEVAKSSYGNNRPVLQQQTGLFNKAVNLSDRTNEAYSIKLFSNHPQTNTKITAYYRKLGENFQSFNLFPLNINQEAWMARINQGFWKKRIALDAGIRKNDFVSPIAAPSFSSKTVFKSAQLSVRVPKYPFVSVGFYPTSQLSLASGNTLTENQYNTFNAIVNYSYTLAKTGMNTNAVYTRFYNNSSDTGFIYFNAMSGTVNHSFFLGKLTLQTGISFMSQKDLELFSAEQLLSWQYKTNISLSSSLKWNRHNPNHNLIGGTASINISVKRLGVFQFHYEKTFLPGYNRQLLPVDIGSAGFYKEF